MPHKHRRSRRQARRFLSLAETAAALGLVVQPKYPIGTDPDAMERLIQDEIQRRGLVPGRQVTRQDLQRRRAARGRPQGRAAGDQGRPPD
jgi:hypothetical protein